VRYGPFMVIQGHRNWYQSEVCMQLHISLPLYHCLPFIGSEI